MLEIEIVEVSVTQMGFALILKPPGRSRIVPIFIGPLETYSISMALQGQKTERPLTHDLIKIILDSLGFVIKKVVVYDFQEGTFFAKIYLENKNNSKSGNSIEIDARPSDAIAMAIRLGSPIFMTKEVYEQTAIEMEELREHIQREESPLEEENQVLDTLFGSLEDDFSASGNQPPQSNLIQGILSEFDQPPEGKPKSQQKKQVKISPSSEPLKEDFQSREDVLKQMLRTAINQERYEDAALIRDKLKEFKLSSGNKTTEKKKSKKKNPTNKGSN